ncbi:hypothetical protein RhiJN_14431 [Ceratobasidium sp. AG-Ba]|nr:hypothetical protein RhiJN_14431 [Ceratobasidium sp. AG-Ba]QRW14975.1 hypothetical protein RhiLY_13974 [Ceratobasidium sp. AG-Ba]
MAEHSTTGIFAILVISIFAFVFIWWGIAKYTKRNQQLPPGVSGELSTRSASRNVRPSRDPVVRAEAGENTDDLPKYSAEARGDEQTVDRNTSRRPNWMTALRQATLPTQPPPAYDPSAPRPSS